MEADAPIQDVVTPPVTDRGIRARLRQPVRPWMLVLGAKRGMGPLQLALLSLAVLLPPTVWAEAPVINPFLIAYSLGILLHLIRRQEAELGRLGPVLPAPLADAELLSRQIELHPRWMLWSTWIVGPGLMLAVNAPSAMIAEYRSGAPMGLAELWSVVLASFFWVVFLQVMVILFRNALLFHRLGARHVHINLLDVGSLTPFARVAVRNFLIFMGGLTLAPLQLIQDVSYFPQLSLAMLASLPFCAVLVALPVWAVHLRLAETKREEYERVQRALLGESDALVGSPIEADGGNVSLTNLILYRDMIRNISEWPFDQPAMIRVVTYVVIPLAAWIGAAVVQHWVEALF